MNQANTICLIAYMLFMAHLANILCFGLNPQSLGGWGPMMLMTCGPLVGYALGRTWLRGDCTDEEVKITRIK